ncbi:hypothetical protein C8F04DRAFT_969740 [Mycena alexandri]|uniref:DUF7223 domain-containing protein n=1 Tax=Mycena alexandri TaxID=1745969 RepID=A0AAD6WQZ2_9AGAR|nr:hypothetical protein C8F04DRAFT_969740 [Mycena alexandri]
MFSSVLVIVPFLAGINALNDWSVPCTSGSCSYDLAATPNAPSGTLKIWGSTNAITDITTAAGWQILGCDPTAHNQSIRLVCTEDPNDANSNCNHLYQSIGAVNKIVRLPQSCGASAFARVAKSWVPDDQSIPSSVRRRIVRRDGAAPVVKALAIDTNFDAVDWSQTGMVNIAIQGANVPGAPTEIKTSNSRRSLHARNHQRDAADAAKNAATKAADAAKNAATKAESIAAAVANNTIDVSKSFDLPPINFNKNINLINSAVTCGSTSLSMQVDMDAQANAQITLAIAATGTIVPPNIKSFGVIAGMTATVAGTMTMTADLSGALSSGQIQLVNIGIPGLDFPGIFTVGPSFQVNAQVDGNVDVQMDLTVGINYNVNNAKITFPPDNSTAPDSAAFTAGDTPLTLNAAPDVTATGQITAHLIPSINLGINALGGKAEAQISLALDANAALNMNLDGSISKTGTIDNSAAADNSTTTDDSSSADNSTVTDDGNSTITSRADDNSTDVSTSSTSSLGGCVNVAGNVNLKATATGSFFGLFDQVQSKPFFNKDFQIFNVRRPASPAAACLLGSRNASALMLRTVLPLPQAPTTPRLLSSMTVARTSSTTATADLSMPMETQ